MSTVLFLSGRSSGDSLKRMGDSYRRLFNAQGYDFLVIDLHDQANLKKNLDQAIRSGAVEFVLSYMGYGSDMAFTDETGKSHNLWQAMGAPFLALFGDSPAYFFDRHVGDNPNFANLYGFPEHEALRRRLPKIGGFVGGFKPLLLDTFGLDELDFASKAAGQLFFLKNGNDPKRLWDSWSVLKHRPLQALRDLASQLAANLADEAGNQIDDLVTAYFGNFGFDLSTMPKLRLFFIAQLDDYFRRLKSTMIAEALMEFPVQIRGVNWEHLDFSGKRATYVPDASYAVSSRLIRDGLGVIDVSPNTGLAPHDRPCRAFGAYTLCLTNEQEFFRHTLPHHQAFSFPLHRQALQDKVADVLAHPARYVDIGIDVATAFRRSNPPEGVVRHLIDTAAMINLDQRRQRLPDSPDFMVWPPNSLA